MEEFVEDQSTINGGNGKETTNHRDQSASAKDGGDYMELDGEAHLNTYLLPGRHDPCYLPCSFVAPQAHCSNVTSTVRGAAKQIDLEPIASDTASAEAQRLFLTDELLLAGLQDFNLNGIFDSLKSTFPPVAAPVQNKSPELEGWSVPGDHVNALLPKPAVMNRTSRFGWSEKREVSDTSEVTESRVFRRKFLVKEHSEAHSRVLPSSIILNSDDGEIDTNSTSRGNEIDEDDFRQCPGTRQQPESSLENVIHSHVLMMNNLGIEFEAEFGSDVQYEQQINSKDVGDPCPFEGSSKILHELGEEVLMKTMGWFPVEEYPNEENHTNLSLRWILDEPPSASDLPHLESLMEISPSKFWSPKSESRKRPPVQFGYLTLSESPQSSHSIQYFLNDSPTSSPEVTRTILGGASDVRISSKESNHRCSHACRNIHGTAQKILTPIFVGKESMKISMKSPSLGSDRNLAAQVQGVPETSPALSEDNPKETASRELNMGTPVHQDHTHHQETCSVAKLTVSETAARRLPLFQRGKNLVMDFPEVGRTMENIEAGLIKNDIPHKDTAVLPNATLWTQIENTSDKMRLQFVTGLSTKERESAIPSLELQIIRGGDGNWLTKRASQGDQNCTRKTAVPLVPLSDISNHPNLATNLRNSLHEKLESQLLYLKPLSESLKNERPVTLQCPELTPDNFAWSNPAVPRVSRKRSSRITTPNLMRVDVLNMFGNGKVAQPVRTTPDKDYYTCKRRKTTRKWTFVELPTSQGNVKLQSTPASDCEPDLRAMAMQEGTGPQKPPTLTRIIKPLRRIKTSPAKSYTCVRRKSTLRSTVRKGLLTDPRNVNATQFVKNAPVKHPADVSEAVLTSGENPRSSGNAIHRHEVKEGSLPILPAASEISNIGTLRSSKYRGVTRHRHTGRYEAHLWDNTKVKLGLAKRGRQVYLGAYPNEDQAAQAHDLAALKYWGPNAYTNFPLSLYEEELKTMKNVTRDEYIVILRRRSPGFTRGISKYRGVTRHHQEGRWEARIGRHSGAKYHYLGTYDTQEEAAAAYDRAAVRHRGVKAITNFDISNYIKKNSKAHKTVSPASSSSGQV